VSALPTPASPLPDDLGNGSASVIPLLRVDAGLRDAVPEDERRFAERVLVVPRRELGPGQWSPEALLSDSSRPFAALLLHGVVTYDVMLGGRCSANLLGPGDLFRPWRSPETSLPCDARWTVGGDAAIAVLDERFLVTARRWPNLTAVIYERLADQLDAAMVRAAIVALPRVEERVLALFWQLADRWGVVRPDAVVVELSLTHALIGRLVGAQRPTVSLALHALAADGLLRRTPEGAWALAHDSRAPLESRIDHRLADGDGSGPHPVRERPAPPSRPAIHTAALHRDVRSGDGH
jgi:CRP/FNR family cyclic AMP-dependent transcriptional regulator